MGRVIIKFKNGHLESFKCKSSERAEEIYLKRPCACEWNYYEKNDRIPLPRKKVKRPMPTSFEELELMMKQQGLFY